MPLAKMLERSFFFFQLIAFYYHFSNLEVTAVRHKPSFNDYMTRQEQRRNSIALYCLRAALLSTIISSSVLEYYLFPFFFPFPPFPFCSSSVSPGPPVANACPVSLIWLNSFDLEAYVVEQTLHFCYPSEHHSEGRMNDQSK